MRAFKSTLEDLEEKRSIHSFHSLHSIRSWRGHSGHRPLTEEASTSQRNGSYVNMAMVMHENQLKLNGKSRSAENVTLVDSSNGVATVCVSAARTPSPRTFSASDLHTIHEASSLFETPL